MGGTIAARLTERGDEVVGVDRRPGGATTHVIDITDPAVARLLRGVDAVIHTAALHAPDVGVASQTAFESVNVEGTRRLLDAAASARVTRFVYTSSTSAFGHALVPSNRAVWVTEDLPARPRDVYDETKLVAERLCDEAASVLSTMCLRVCRCFTEPEDVLARYRLYRGADVRDIALGHELALDRPAITGMCVLAARSPFEREDCERLLTDPASVIAERAPAVLPLFASRGWALPDRIDRVYVIERAARLLGFVPHWNAVEYFDGV